MLLLGVRAETAGKYTCRNIALTMPTLWDKDRFLRIFTLVAWADRMDSYWQNLPRPLKAKIGFY